MNERVTWDDVRQLRHHGVPLLLVDVREAEEVALGGVTASRHIPLGQLEFHAPIVLPNKAQSIVCFCQSGRRSAMAARLLRTLGYTNVASLEGGYEALDEIDADHKI